MRILENVRSRPSAAEQLPFLAFESLFVFPAKLHFFDGCSLLLLRWILTRESKLIFFRSRTPRIRREYRTCLFFGDPAQERTGKAARKGLMTKNQKAETSKPALLHAKCSVEPRIRAAFSPQPANKRRLKNFRTLKFLIVIGNWTTRSCGFTSFTPSANCGEAPSSTRVTYLILQTR